ncbi:MAG TPA: hypothetical protein VK534_00995, partial [Methylomirabilota bacterium]|nr:hypothetical protein [Methylomirabilota bacterium]
MKEYNKHRIPVVLAVVVLVAGLGAYLLISTKAATPFATTEPANGAISAPATQQTDVSASGGSYVKFGSVAGSGGGGGGTGTPDAAAILAMFAPGTTGEALPHGVPSGYDWYSKANSPQMTPPATANNMNWWGQIYVDNTDIHSTNVRVEINNCQLWVLANGTWSNRQNSSAGFGGGDFTEDFSSSSGTPNFISGPTSGSTNVIPISGHNVHYWGNQGLITAPGMQAVISVCRVRAIMASSSGPDNRDTSHYL